MPSDMEREAAELAAFNALIAGKKEASEKEVYLLELLEAQKVAKANFEKEIRFRLIAIEDIASDIGIRTVEMAKLVAVKARGKWYVKA